MGNSLYSCGGLRSVRMILYGRDYYIWRNCGFVTTMIGTEMWAVSGSVVPKSIPISILLGIVGWLVASGNEIGWYKRQGQMDERQRSAPWLTSTCYGAREWKRVQPTFMATAPTPRSPTQKISGCPMARTGNHMDALQLTGHP